ncbi:hypothetical protein BJ991_002218 [Microbacterium immunditiarum]|uniref:Uncharacterized protein n=1 Tax=Microbacterium immunditiarum TaxID=337480 RepID=A0A7Y9GPA5_9MICO|nr:hypothetical protein [Microbacterium immunditiarum]
MGAQAGRDSIVVDAECGDRRTELAQLAIDSTS